MKIVIVGLSAAGLSALTTLTRMSPKCEITVISEEELQPYSRCLLTHYIGKEITKKNLFISDTSQFSSNVKFMMGKKAISIDSDKKLLLLSDKENIIYDAILLATGADPIKPDYTKTSDKVFTLRYFKDAEMIENNIKETATIVGGGFVGIKTAYGFIERGIKVNMIISSPYPLSMILDEETGKLIENELKNLGISIYKNSDIVDLKDSSTGVNITLASGQILKSKIVVVGKGVTPRVEVAKSSGIKVGKGVVVDSFLETSKKSIFAAGDCIESFDITKNTTAINAIWPMAVEQGYYAAMNILGAGFAYPGSIGFNSLKTKTFHLISAGTLKGNDLQTFSHYNPFRNQYKKITLKNDIPVGMAFLNAPEDAGILVNLIRKGVSIELNPEKIVKGEASLLQILINRR